MAQFLDLPSEIRNQIYRLLLPLDRAQFIRTGEGQSVFLAHVKQPALTLTCQQIQREALSIFFSSESFLLSYACGARTSVLDPGTLLWLTRVGDAAAHIKRLEIVTRAMMPSVHKGSYHPLRLSFTIYVEPAASHRITTLVGPRKRELEQAEIFALKIKADLDDALALSLREGSTGAIGLAELRVMMEVLRNYGAAGLPELL